MARFRIAILIPLTVFPAAVATALFVGWTLHQFPKELAPLIALFLVLAITAAGALVSLAMKGSPQATP